MSEDNLTKLREAIGTEFNFIDSGELATGWTQV